MLEGGSVAVIGDDEVASNKAVRQMEDRVRELERQLGRKTLEVRSSRKRWTSCMQKTTLLAQSHLKDGSR